MTEGINLIRKENFRSRNYEYFHRAGGLTFSTAQAECEKQDARLALFKDEESLNITTSFLLTQNMSYWWVGLHKSTPTNVWLWTDGEPLNQSVTSITGDMDYTDCAVLLNLRRSKRIHLYGLDCRTDTPQYFICETNVTKHLPTTVLNSGFNPSSEGSTAAFASSAALLVFAALFLIFRLCRRKRSYDDTLEEASTKTECSRIRNDDTGYVDMAPTALNSRGEFADPDYEFVDDGGGYSAIGPTVTSEDGLMNDNEREEVVYTQVFTVRRSAQMEKEPINPNDVYAKVMKKK